MGDKLCTSCDSQVKRGNDSTFEVIFHRTSPFSSSIISVLNKASDNR